MGGGMIRIIRYKNKYYIFPGMNDPLEWAYQIYRYNNPGLPGVTNIPKGKMLIAIREDTATKKAERLQWNYMGNYPDDPIKIDKIKTLFCSEAT